MDWRYDAANNLFVYKGALVKRLATYDEILSRAPITNPEFQTGIRLPYTATNGILLYNTADQVNGEVLKLYWNNNTAFVNTDITGTSINRRALEVGSGVSRLRFQDYAVPFYKFGRISDRSGTHWMFNGVMNSGTDGVQIAGGFYPTINQTGLAGFVGFQVIPYLQSVGTGNRYIFRVGVSDAPDGEGIVTNYFVVYDNGDTYFKGKVTTDNTVFTALNEFITKRYADGITGIGAPVAVSGNYTTSTTRTIKVSGTGTITLSVTVVPDGFEYIIKNVGSGTVTVNVAGGGTIDGVTSKTITGTNAGAKFTRDGTNYLVTGTF